ncbi:MAG: hypothetical protein JRG93_07330 [Deltaproteobacteria bacterium]|nr:hypothetical protein [Deltaproteobacteria bacterium]MBW2189388.1 hypothetical protein [Deltaproteobacteria bacterium]MBW2224607.1 hypothetical protein [Deltaproteobacteria bacterium]MBW2405009.1 hypothetical protein [Deltaproteobacteria bacterium]MBW2546966.1 hypothetical protein [Deltaproteobacteria bacterium]
MHRREFLKKTMGILAAGAGLGPWVAGGCNEAATSGRQAVTMWEFSWLTRREGAEAEYADWDKVLDELSERGYDTIRMDAFPHLVARGPEGKQVDRFTILPQTPLFMWGNHAPVEVEPRAALIEFITKVRSRGMHVGLSTWFNDDALQRAATVVTPADYARIWRETLDHLADANLLDAVLWVDLCNEFPIGKWAKGAYPLIFDGANPENPAPAIAPWSLEAQTRVQQYLDEGIGPVREAYPELSYTYSFESVSGGNARQLDTSTLDVAEVHVWLSSDIEFNGMSGQLELLLELDENALAAHAEKAPDVYFSERDRWLSTLEGLVDDWADWATERGLPLITSEAWGPINYDDVDSIAGTSEWDWVKDVCDEGVHMAVDKGWSGICTSNFAQPHFEGMWSDVAWHQEQTARIRRGSHHVK